MSRVGGGKYGVGGCWWWGSPINEDGRAAEMGGYMAGALRGCLTPIIDLGRVYAAPLLSSARSLREGARPSRRGHCGLRYLDPFLNDGLIVAIGHLLERVAQFRVILKVSARSCACEASPSSELFAVLRQVFGSELVPLGAMSSVCPMMASVPNGI